MYPAALSAPQLQALEITMWSDWNRHLHFETDSDHTIVFSQICIVSLWFYCVINVFGSHLKAN